MRVQANTVFVSAEQKNGRIEFKTSNFGKIKDFKFWQEVFDMKFNLEKLKQKKQKEVPNYMGDYVQECL